MKWLSMLLLLLLQLPVPQTITQACFTESASRQLRNCPTSLAHYPLPPPPVFLPPLSCLSAFFFQSHSACKWQSRTRRKPVLVLSEDQFSLWGKLLYTVGTWQVWGSCCIQWALGKCGEAVIYSECLANAEQIKGPWCVHREQCSQGGLG